MSPGALVDFSVRLLLSMYNTARANRNISFSIGRYTGAFERSPTGGLVEQLKQQSAESPAVDVRKPWHVPQVWVAAVPGITANVGAHTTPGPDSFGFCAS